MGSFMAARLRSYRTPAVEAEELAGKTKELKKDGDAIAGELTEEGAQDLLPIPRTARRWRCPTSPKECERVGEDLDQN